MKATVICFVVMVVVFASALPPPVTRKPRPGPSLCVFPEDFRVWTLKCMYSRVSYDVKELMNYILNKGGWEVQEFSRALCNPYMVFKLRSYFRKRTHMKLLKKATIEADKCLRYLLRNTNNA